MAALFTKRSYFSLAPGATPSEPLAAIDEREAQRAAKKADKKRAAAETAAAAAGLSPSYPETLRSKSNALFRSSTKRVIHKARSSSHIPSLSGSDKNHSRPNLALDTSFNSARQPRSSPYYADGAASSSTASLVRKPSASPYAEHSAASAYTASTTSFFLPRTRPRPPESPLTARNISLPPTSTPSSYPSEPQTPSTITNATWHSSPLSEPTPTMATHRKDSDPKSALSSSSDAILSFSTASVARGGGLSYASNSTAPPSSTSTINPSSSSSQSPTAIHAAIQEQCAKRIQTLAYLKRAHEGQLYWFNTLHFSQPDILKLPFAQPPKLARRATNFLLLGLSLPGVLDVKSSGPFEYMRTLHALLVEYDTYTAIHPADGSSGSSLSRARIPHMFRRTGHHHGVGGGGGKGGRRTSSAADIGLPMSATAEPGDLSKMFLPGGGSGGSGINANNGAAASTSSSAAGGVSFAPSEQELLKGEEYTYLLTPSLPFDPDFFETFATLSDILIECYARIMSSVHSPEVCVNTSGGLGIGDVFAKVDAKMRKVIVQGVVRDFEDASKAGVRAELGGVGKVVFGGLL